MKKIAARQLLDLYLPAKIMAELIASISVDFNYADISWSGTNGNRDLTRNRSVEFSNVHWFLRR